MCSRKYLVLKEMTVTHNFTNYIERMISPGSNPGGHLLVLTPLTQTHKGISLNLWKRGSSSETRMLFLSLSPARLQASAGWLSRRLENGPGSSLMSRSRQWHWAGKMVSRGLVCHSSAWHYGGVSLPIWQTDIIYKSHTERRRLGKKAECWRKKKKSEKLVTLNTWWH